MQKKFVNKRRSRGAVSFNPNRQFIEEATAAFLKNGGKIDHLEADEQTFEKSWMVNDIGSDVDDFLAGQ